ncbi:MAG: putative membrane protein [Glaciecola sp.]|jgi:uncharacterized membrane protein
MAICPVCGHSRSELHARLSLGRSAVAALAKMRPGLDLSSELICDQCVSNAQAEAAKQWITQEKGELSELDLDVLAAIRHDRILSAEGEGDTQGTVPEDGTAMRRLEDRVVATIGTWRFPAVILVIVLAWVVVNVAGWGPDPFPVLMLAVVSAVLGTLAAIEAPIILMSQRRQRQVDRQRAVNDYRVNLKAELEIRAIAERLDQLATMAPPRTQPDPPTSATQESP